jgi:hypothetical protein
MSLIVFEITDRVRQRCNRCPRYRVYSVWVGRRLMTSNPVDRESRRSTRVRLKVRIEALGVSEPLTCEGETFVVNLHGALILTALALRVGMKIGIHVLLTGKRAIADVVYVDPEQPRHCGINLEKPENIWGLSSPPPDDWHKGDTEPAP